MSRQFQLYLLPSDADALIRELKSTIDLKIIQDESPTPVPVELQSPVRNHSTRFRNVQASSIRCNLMQASGAQLQMNFYKNPDRWIPDESAEVIESSGCDFNGALLLIGRFYVQTDKLVGNEILDKRPEFTKWADTVFRKAKKLLHYNSELAAYVGNDAANFRKQGGRFVHWVKANGEPAFEPLLM